MEATLDEALHHAVALLRAERLDDAGELLDRILEADPGHPGALHFSGVWLHARGHTADGITRIEAALAREPALPGAWNNLGNLLLSQRRFDEAATAYDAAVRHAGATDPAAADALNNLSTLRRRQARWTDAEAAARAAIARRPGSGDAWYNLSLALMGTGTDRLPEALQANGRAVALWPRQTQGRSQVIRALTLLGERGEAARLYREWLDEEPDNAVVRHMLAACEGGGAHDSAPARASDAYVEQVFDAYADSFDASLERLHYVAPDLVAAEVERRLGAPGGALVVADAGCGTGLCGPLLRPWAARLAGCDLSVGMLRRARARGGYDVLHKAELVHWLVTQPATFDLVVSADTLCYFGDLHTACDAAAAALRPGGHLVFTVEALHTEGVALQPTGRYAHGRAHVEAALGAAGFEAVRMTPAVSRREAGHDVPGWLASARHAARG